MGRIRLEKVAIKKFFLGLFGFDHLHLVYEQDVNRPNVIQDGWYVLEGTRAGASGGPILGVLGTDGETTLTEANQGFEGDDLIAEIGTPSSRGSVVITFPDGEVNAWDTMASFGNEIDEQNLPYIGYSAPGNVIPTINSTSVIASLLFYAGVNIADWLPFGLRHSPGRSTLIGTSSDDELVIGEGFTALFGGDGRDVLEGGTDNNVVERFLGGKDDDIVKWSDGLNLIHGGQIRLDYKLDGKDAVDYTGIGQVTITANSAPAKHHTPDYTANHYNGSDYLFSIEGIYFDDASDDVVLGEGVSLIKFDLTLKLKSEDQDGKGDGVSFNEASDGLIINSAGDNNYFVQDAVNAAGSSAGIWLESAETLVGSQHDDKIYGGIGVRSLDGNAGNDVIDSREVTPFVKSQDGYDVQMFGGAGDDTLVSGKGVSIATGGDGSDRFVLSELTSGAGTVEFVITDADASDRLFVPYSFFDLSYGDFEGSQLLGVLGGLMRESGDSTFADLEQTPGSWISGSHINFAAFEWKTQDQNWNNDDATRGIFDFTGAIIYDRDGSDLLIHVFTGYPIEVTDTGYEDADWTHIVNAFDTSSETIIRVQNFTDGDLGINFYDLGDPSNITLPISGARPRSAYDYAGWDRAVAEITNNGSLEAALELRPEAPAYDPNSDDQGGPIERIAGGGGDDVITVSLGRAEIDGGGGSDTITGSAGSDSIDGGSGADTMQGGRGNDSYTVDDAGDVVVEVHGQGFDSVVSSVDYTLTESIEDLELAAFAAVGIGNELNNLIYGNDRDNSLAGLDGNDTLYAGYGNDAQDGGNGSDTYVYDTADGRDVISDAGAESDTDVLVFSNYVAADIRFHIDADTPNDLELVLADGGRIRLLDFLSGEGRSIDRVEFNDGTVWSRADLDQFSRATPVLSNNAPLAVDDVDFGIRSGSLVLPGAVFTENDTDFDGDQLTIVGLSGVSAGAEVTLDGGNSVKIKTPDAYEGLISFNYTVSDGHATSIAHAEFTIIKNLAPVVAGTIAGQSAKSGQLFNLTLAGGLFSDPDSDALTLTATLSGGAALPAWLTFDPLTNAFAGTPPPDAQSTYNVVVAASDGAASAEIQFTLAVATAPTTPHYVVGTRGRDDLSGTLGDDIIIGRSGDDIMKGFAGDDRFIVSGAYSGNDRFIGGAGVDTIEGRAGNDIIKVAQLTGIEVISGGDGRDVVRFGPTGNIINLSNVTLDSIELITGAGGNDRILGSRGDDRIHGGPGDDVFIFRGNFGDDRILDFVTGTAGDAAGDVINLRGSGYANFAAVMAHASDVGGHTFISLGTKGSILLEGVSMDALKADDFVL